MELKKIKDLITKYNVNNITDDSRKVKSFSIFMAYKGVNLDRREFISEILKDNKFNNIIIFKDIENVKYHGIIECIDESKKIILVNYYNLKENLGIIAKIFYQNHAEYFDISAVTGTNGKTSIVYLLTKALEYLGQKSGYIGTLGTNSNNAEVINTTPGAIELQRILANFHKDEIKYINMEASSHALVQGRLSGIIFNTVIFTNLTPEHLDYHKNMDDYFSAKFKLFKAPYIDDKTVIIINHNDPYGIKLLQNIAKKNYKNKIISYGSMQGANKLNKICPELSSLDYSYIVYENNEITFSEIKKEKFKLETNLIGKFNLYNLLAVICDLYNKNFAIDKILNAIKNIKSIPGRMQQVETTKAKIYIDYAHTPDALDNILKELKQIKNNNQQQLICVFGCGGDRDKFKRPEMGKIAVKYADKIIVTDDNPRTEDPGLIIQDIVKSLTDEEHSKIIINHNRHLAIKDALSLANADDIIIIAGKGHEEYQIYGNNKVYFSDFVVVKSLLD